MQQSHTYKVDEKMQKIGFIGLGIMGKPMATNLIRKGYSLKVYDYNPAPETMKN